MFLHSERRGFTLVELLVVMTLMLVLAGLALLVIPSINTSQQATQAAGQLQQWFEAAKQRAARDRAPRGIRLLPGAANASLVTDLVFLVQSDDYYLGSVDQVLPNPNPLGLKKTIFSRANLSNANGTGLVTFDMFDPSTGTPNPAGATIPRTLTAGQTAANSNLFPVQAGDSIVFDNGSTIYQILAVLPPTAAFPGGRLTLATKFPAVQVASGYSTMEYRIIRQPRPDGDEPLQMPVNIVIDCQQPQQGGFLPAMLANGIDVMFAPDGRVIGPLAGFDKLIFWVRDQTVGLNVNDPTLVVIYPRTGLVAAYPVDLTNFNAVSNTNPTPYTFTKTGIRSNVE